MRRLGVEKIFPHEHADPPLRGIVNAQVPARDEFAVVHGKRGVRNAQDPPLIRYNGRMAVDAVRIRVAPRHDDAPDLAGKPRNVAEILRFSRKLALVADEPQPGKAEQENVRHFPPEILLPIPIETLFGHKANFHRTPRFFIFY